MDNKNTQILLEINDLMFDPNYIPGDKDQYKIRRATRGILLRENTIALEHISKRGYYKLPGGGIEGDETIENAFKREIQEEVGCMCKIIATDGITHEYRDREKTHQISYAVLAEVTGFLPHSQLTQTEIDSGLEVAWVTLEEAQELLETASPKDWEGKFIQKRDIAIFYHLKGILH